ncbi:uncharacterized protein LOC122371807 [Amphibalanus amphitrite]|uniref:uncharacterized protein LOC122371807 n=1 Tax=Amphibalanus amphitrite TaxID=1232801 RepID=UPI001C922754|nr:uncharacterized protein LOC122371807 [Amphibalanus amphitrite]
MADSVLITKIVVLVLFFTVTMLCGLLPVMLLRLARFGTKRFQTGRMGALLSALRRRGDLLVSCVMCLGAGVLLATIFTHMIAESREVFAEIEKAGLLPELDLPLSELFLCAGFFLVFFIEEMAHTFMKHGRRRKHRRAAAAAEAAEAGEKTNDDPSTGSEEEEHAHGAAGHSHVVDIGGQHAFRAYLIVIALSVHSVFEGFAAAFEDSAREVWLFFAAIMAHKAIVSFCIGEQLLTAKRSKCFVITNLCIFSMATPLGVLLGLLVASPELQGGASLLATGILQGLAAGTILYVTFFELLGPEQHKPGSGLIKFFAMLLGFALMLVIHHSAGHSHSHGGHAHAVGAHGHGHHGHGAMAHGHGHGASGDQHSDVTKRVQDAIHAYDHDYQGDQPDQSEHHDHDHDHNHDHHDHSKESQHSEHKHKSGHDHDHDHDHSQKATPSGASEASVVPSTDRKHTGNSGHDHSDHSNHDHSSHDSNHHSHNQDNPSSNNNHSNDGHDHSHHDHDHSSPVNDHSISENSGHSDHHDHSADHAHSDQPSQSGEGEEEQYDTTYELFDSDGATENPVDVRTVPDGTAKDHPKDELHHFHADGHDHLGPLSNDTVGQMPDHDHSDHTGHDHFDHAPKNVDQNHPKHDGHDHTELGGKNGTSHSDTDHPGHAAHDHSDHSSHEHSGPADQHPGPPSETTDRPTSADLA